MARPQPEKQEPTQYLPRLHRVHRSMAANMLLCGIPTLHRPQSAGRNAQTLGPVIGRWHAQELGPSHSCATSHSDVEKGVASGAPNCRQLGT